VLVVPRRRTGRPRGPAAGGDAGPPRREAFADVVGDDPEIRRAVDKARRVAPTAAPILFLGETGVGKERFARSVHASSAVAEGPFVALNCGGLSRDLLASKLFGYAEGAFTGARKGGMNGKIEAAHGGTLFLDEIGEMPLDLQPMFLRVLEEREVCRLGEVAPRRVDFRVVAATNRELKREVEAGRFRADLYYRLAVVAIRIPPLRARQGAIHALVEHVRADVERRYGLPPRPIAPDVVRRLEAHDWPGNVRELRNVIESALLTAAGDVVTSADLPDDQRRDDPGAALVGDGDDLGALAAGEREQIRRTLAAYRGNVTAAARALGLAKSTLYAKIKRYGLAIVRHRGAG
jgi:transcriptional regulator with PAS, ATPase and Fis domain